MADYPRRLNFVHGQNLTAEDWQAEQDYHRSMRHLQNRLLGRGAVSGLEVAPCVDGLTITPGVAIDVQGRELILAEARLVPLHREDLAREWDVVVVWAQTPDRTFLDGDGRELVSMWSERPEAMVVAPDQGPPEAVRLVRVAPGPEGAPVLDRSVRHRHPTADPQPPSS